MIFHVGQKVVCVSAPVGITGLPPLITVGAVYTVSGFQGDTAEALDLVLLAEQPARNLLGETSDDMGFPLEFFRPIAERKTDISIFQAMLNLSREGVPA